MENEQTSEQEQSKESAVKKREESVQPSSMPWLRPAIGLFSILTALMYVCAAAIFFLSRIGLSEGIQGIIQTQVDAGVPVEEARAEIEKVESIVTEHFGMLFLALIAAVAAASLMLGVSGIGLLLKKSWSISMGRLACLTMIAVLVFLVVLHKPGFEALVALQPGKEGQELGHFTWMSAVRYIFLCCMCPISLLIAYGALVKQYTRPA